MSILRNIVGLILVFISWFNFFNFPVHLRIALFILGFDAASVLAKTLLFLINFFFPFLVVEGIFLLWTLLFLIIFEFTISFSKKLSFLIFLIKPTIIFFSIFFGMKDVQLALIVAGLDLVLNLKR